MGGGEMTILYIGAGEAASKGMAGNIGSIPKQTLKRGLD